MRTEYKCVCDGCGVVIKFPNNENDVSFNHAQLQVCPECFRDICSLLEINGYFNRTRPIQNETEDYP